MSPNGVLVCGNMGKREPGTVGSGANRTRYHHGNLRQALMDAAVDLITTEGVAGFSLNAAARAAGVSTAAPYRHFASKEALLSAVVERGWKQFGAALQEAAARHPDDPLQRLAALGQTYIAFAVKHPAIFRLLFAEREREPLRSTAGLATFATLLACVRQARERGQLRPCRDDRQIAQSAWGLVHGLATLHLDNVLGIVEPDASPSQLGSVAIDLFINGLRHHAPDPPANPTPGVSQD